MPCYYPITGYKAKKCNPETGKRSIVFNKRDGYIDRPVVVPCGRCIGCRLEYSRQWAIRCVHEAQMHEHNSFITLTYNERNLPDDKSIHKEEIQAFFKRFRKHLTNEHGSEKDPEKPGRFRPRVPIRYFACGEYGEEKGRPHYHAIIFGYSFPDRYLYTVRNGNPLYRSPELESLWNKGHSLIGECTFESAAYVARYVTKKWKKHHEEEEETEIDMERVHINRETGEITEVEPEFCLMSRNPGIGATWLKKFKSDTDKDFITINGTVMSLPKYYDMLLEREDPKAMMRRKGKRIANFNEEENTFERLVTREKVKIAQVGLLKRDLEEKEI